MSSKPQSIIRRVSVCVTKELRRRLLLGTDDSNAQHVAIAVVHSNFEDIACRFRAKLTYSVKNPEHRNPEITFSAFSSAFEHLENCAKVELTPEAHAYGDIDLCVLSILYPHTLHQTVLGPLDIIATLQYV